MARDFVIPAIQQARNATLAAVCDTNPEATKGFNSLPIDRLLESDLEAIYIATPNDSHAELTQKAARAGKHILCEKPMATSLADAKQMGKACQTAGVSYGTAFDQRFHDAHSQIRQLVNEGKLGVVTLARIHYACWLPPDWSVDNWRTNLQRAGGGAFIDLAPHGIDLLQYLLNDELVELTCFKQRKVFDYQVDDGAVAIGRTANNILVSLNIAYNCPDEFPRRTLEILGTEAMVVATNTMGQTPGGSVRMIDKRGSSIHVPFDQERSPFLNQIEAFSDCLLKQTEFPFSVDKDIQTMRLVATCL